MGFVGCSAQYRLSTVRMRLNAPGTWRPCGTPSTALLFLRLGLPRRQPPGGEFPRLGSGPRQLSSAKYWGEGVLGRRLSGSRSKMGSQFGLTSRRREVDLKLCALLRGVLCSLGGGVLFDLDERERSVASGPARRDCSRPRMRSFRSRNWRSGPRNLDWVRSTWSERRRSVPSKFWTRRRNGDEGRTERHGTVGQCW